MMADIVINLYSDLLIIQVIELLLKSVQCIAHHGSLSKTHKRLSLKSLFSGRALALTRPPTNSQDLDSTNIKKKFSGMYVHQPV